MPISQDILPVIPVGEENAVTAHLLWRQLGMWSLAAVKAKLNEMAAEGLVARKRVLRNAQETSLYFRTPTPSAGWPLGLEAKGK